MMESKVMKGISFVKLSLRFRAMERETMEGEVGSERGEKRTMNCSFFF